MIITLLCRTLSLTEVALSQILNKGDNSSWEQQSQEIFLVSFCSCTWPVCVLPKGINRETIEGISRLSFQQDSCAKEMTLLALFPLKGLFHSGFQKAAQSHQTLSWGPVFSSEEEQGLVLAAITDLNNRECTLPPEPAQPGSPPRICIKDKVSLGFCSPMSGTSTRQSHFLTTAFNTAYLLLNGKLVMTPAFHFPERQSM